MEIRRKFSPEFKQEAVRLLKTSDKSAAVIARELGIPRNRIYKWATDVDASGDKAFAGTGRPFKKSGRVLCARTDVKYAWIKSASVNIRTACRVLKVSRSGYYDWLRRKPSTRHQANHGHTAHQGAP